MNKLIKIGKYVNTHGIKGEIKIISDFDRKDKAFIKGNTLIINNISYTIKSYRRHKMFDMITFLEINDINQIENLKGNDVYLKRTDLKLEKDEIIYKDLIGLVLIENNKELGQVIDYVYNNKQMLLKVKGVKEFYVPYNEHFIDKVDINKKQIYTSHGSELIL